jgi:hypothetical protein
MTEEELADYFHSLWAGWMDYLYSKSIPTEHGVLIPREYAERWSRQCNTEYKDLPENEKESDRIEAKKFIKRFGQPAVPSVEDLYKVIRAWCHVFHSKDSCMTLAIDIHALMKGEK